MADPITITDLTAGVITGDGVFDKLMASMSSQLQEEYRTGRITGTEYASLYAATLQSSIDRALTFLLERDKNLLEREILEKQRDTLELGKVTVVKEQEILVKQKDALVIAETTALKQQELLVKQKDALIVSETTSLREQEILEKQRDTLEIGKVTAAHERDLAAAQILNMQAATCKLQAEFDVLVKTLDKMSTEILLLNQKKVTETAQTNGAGITADSVIGKQTLLYGNQASAFLRDAEQKAAGIMTDVWNVSRTTDEATVRDATNKLADANIGAVVTKLMDGVGV